MQKFTVNPKIFATAICYRGRSYRKAEIYDPVVERIPLARYNEMMRQKMGELFFFVEAEIVGGSDGPPPNAGAGLGPPSNKGEEK